ncbi:MAG: oligoribonuclease [Hyphomicrobiaceae bacterium]|jgi:oligoribonuclease
MPQPHENLVWLDMEMTGLDPKICVPLQVAIILTTPDLKPLDEIEMTIQASEENLGQMDDFVLNMHTTNGLLEQVRKAELSLERCDELLAEFLERHIEPGSGLLAGNSIHQDRRFLEAYFPLTSRFLHYRMVDVSTIKELVRRWYSSRSTYAKTTADHTALADIKESISELAHYRKHFFRDPTNS